MLTHNLRSIQEIESMPATKEKIFQDVADTVTTDTALPQQWLNQFSKWCSENYPAVTYDLIRSSCVWAYHKGNLFGFPVTCCIEVIDAYSEWNQ